MANVKIAISWTDTNSKKGTTNITNINPEASNNDLVDFAQMLNDLTGNTYTGTTKITEEDIYKTNGE